MLNTGPDLPAYRDAVADLLLEMAGYTGPGDRSKAEKVLTERIGDAELTAVLAATPQGTDAAAQRLIREVRHYQPNVRSCPLRCDPQSMVHDRSASTLSLARPGVKAGLAALTPHGFATPSDELPVTSCSR
jgi:hypothetical protein